MHLRSIAAITLAICLLHAGTLSVDARAPMALGYSHDPAGLLDEDMAIVDATIERLGAAPATWTLWSNWGSRAGEAECPPDRGRCAFPSAAAAGLRERGITPFIWWQPSATTPAEQPDYARYIHIINGRHDDYIRTWAMAARDHGGPILLRFAHEMNGRWYPWSIERYDNTPERYRKAWRHIWRIFQEVGADNVRFLWSPAREACRGCTDDAYADFYPGNRYVDYVGLNAYNGARNRWRPLAAVLERPMEQLLELTRTRTYPRGKPVILGEVGSNHLGGDKATWLREGYDEVYRRWPKVKAMVIFDIDMSQRNATHPDWRLDLPVDGSALAAYRAIVDDPRFGGRLPAAREAVEPGG